LVPPGFVLCDCDGCAIPTCCSTDYVKSVALHLYSNPILIAVKNNPQSGNLRTLIKLLLELAGQLKDESKCERYIRCAY
jgi:hypothetical protein